MKYLPGAPLRSAIVDGSALLMAVRVGLSALLKKHSSCIDEGIRDSFVDSLDLDSALESEYPNDHRWDYLLGHKPSRSVIGLEPHSANQGEISVVIAKRRAALQHLKSHLKPGAGVTAWLWVASGKVNFANTEKARLRLDQGGVKFVDKKVMEKHLKALKPRTR